MFVKYELCFESNCYELYTMTLPGKTTLDERKQVFFFRQVAFFREMYRNSRINRDYLGMKHGFFIEDSLFGQGLSRQISVYLASFVYSD